MAHFPTFSLGGRERDILKSLDDELALVKTCVTAFQTVVGAVASEDPAVPGLTEKVFELEDKAAALKRDIESEIAEGAFFGGIREDMLGLVGQIYSIAKVTKDAARMLVIGTQGDGSGREFLQSEHVGRFFAELFGTLASLQELLVALKTDTKAVVELVHKVQSGEARADLEKAALLEELFRVPRRIDPVLTIQLRDFIFCADDIADNAEDASDIVLVLVAKGYG